MRRGRAGLVSGMSGRKSYTKGERAELAAHIMQERLARAAMAVSAAAGLVGAIWHGLPSILLGAAVAGFFSLARPGPSDKLDDWTGRGR